VARMQQKVNQWDQNTSCARP